MKTGTTNAEGQLDARWLVFPLALYATAISAPLGFAVSRDLMSWEVGLWCSVLGVGTGLLAALSTMQVEV